MKPGWLVLCIAIVVAGAYVNTIDNGFVWDDEYLTAENALNFNLKNVFGAFKRPLFTGIAGENKFYRPVQSVTYIIDYTLGRGDPSFYHITNIIFHIINVLLVFFLFLKILGRVYLAFSGALLFGLHPIHTEAVAYISGRADLLACMFMLLAILSFDGALRKQSIILCILSILFFATSIFSKEIGLIFPVLLGCYELIILKGSANMQNMDKCSKKTDTSFGRLRFIRKIFYTSVLCILVAYLMIRNAVPGMSTAFVSRIGIVSSIRLLRCAKIFSTYLGILLAPVNLHMERALIQHVSLFGPATFLSVLLLSVFIGCIFLSYRKNNALCFGCSWYFLTLLPVCGILPLNADIAEHWLYIPSLGFVMSFASLLGFMSAFRTKRQYIKKAAIGICVVIICAVFFVLTVKQNTYWSDPVKLYERILQFEPKSFRANFNLGKEYFKHRDYEKAIEHYERAALARPLNDKSYNNLGAAYQMRGDLKKAEENYRKSIELAPKEPLSYVNLATIIAEKGEMEEARRLYDKALEFAPDDKAISEEHKRFMKRYAIYWFEKNKDSLLRIGPDSGQ